LSEPERKWSVSKRFHVVSTEYETEPSVHFCNSNKKWERFLNARFSHGLKGSCVQFQKVTSNASFRIVGLELKVGLLLSDDEFRIRRGKLLESFQRPPLVMDSVLAIYGILEGLSMLSYFESLPPNLRDSEINKGSRGDKISKGIKAATGENVSAKVLQLKQLRNRCMHQDEADRLQGYDFELTFDVRSLRPHVGLLYEYLASLASLQSPLPDTNLNEFWHFED
jgi:hypothetical protein